MKKILFALVAAALLVTPAFASDRTPSPKGATVYIVSPSNGATVTQPFTIVFGLKGMGIAPAGADCVTASTGHHHLLIDQGLPGLDEPMGKSATLRHFGKGQTETTINDLKPGKHTLQLILGDTSHVPHNPPVTSKVVTITVK